MKELHAQIARLGLRDSVRLVGHVEDIAAAYLAAHVTVIASTEPEAFGRTAVEAAALGCPVIATNIGAPPETVLAQPIAAPQTNHRMAGAARRAAALAPVLAEALALAPSERAAMGKARAGMCSPISPPRPCSAGRLPSTTGCLARRWQRGFNAASPTNIP